MRRALLPSVLLLAVAFAGCVSEPNSESALDYLAAQLPEQSLESRIHIAVAAAAAGQDLSQWPSADNPILAQLERPSGYGDGLRLLLALGLHGGDAPTVTRAELMTDIWQSHDGRQFGFDGILSDDALVINALVTAGADPLDERIQSSASMLLDFQADDGGWSWNGDVNRGEPDETAWIVHALAQAGRLDDNVRNQVAWFMTERMNDDGFYAYGPTRNCQSTGLALIAWHHVGEIFDAVHHALGACQNRDGGFPYLDGEESQLWATAEILQGLSAVA